MGGLAHPLRLDHHTSTLREQPVTHHAVRHPSLGAATAASAAAATTPSQDAHSAGTSSHMMHVRIPASLSAGVHALEMVLDRDSFDFDESQGRVIFHQGSADNQQAEGGLGITVPMVTVSPTITEIHPRQAATGEDITITGSGFAHMAARNTVVLPGGRSCAPIRTDVHYLVCTVGRTSPHADPPFPPPAHKGIPLQLHPSTKEVLRATAACFRAVPRGQSRDAVLCHTNALSSASAYPPAPMPAEHFVATNEAAWPSLHPVKRHDGFRDDTFLATSTAQLRPPSTAIYRFRIGCDGLTFDLCAATVSGPGLDVPIFLNSSTVEAAVLLQSGTAVYTVDWVFSHLEHGNQAALFVSLPSASSSVPTSQLMPVPAEWFEHGAHTATSSRTNNSAGSHDDMVTLVVNGIPAVCRSAAGSKGCTWGLSKKTSNPSATHDARKRVTATVPPYRSEQSWRSRRRLPLVISPLQEHAVHRWRRAIPASALRWSKHRASVAAKSLPDPLIVPAGETWLLDTDLDAFGIIVYGALVWDIEAKDVQLRANYILVEGQGKFLIGTEDSPMLNLATVHIKNAKCAWQDSTCKWALDAASGKAGGNAQCQKLDALIKGHPTWTAEKKTVNVLVIKNANGRCLKARGSGNAAKVEVGECEKGVLEDTMWSYAADTGLLKNQHGGCLDTKGLQSQTDGFHMWSCSASNSNQQFDIDASTGSVKHRHSNCMAATGASNVGLDICNPSLTNQQWEMTEVTVTVNVDPHAEMKASERCRSAYSHPHLGRRFVGGYKGFSSEFAGLTLDEFETIAKPKLLGTGPEISFYGRPLPKTWSTLDNSTKKGEKALAVHDLATLGWSVGDEVAVTITSGSGIRSTIAKVGVSGGNELVLEDALPDMAEGGYRTYDDTTVLMSAEVMNLARSIVVTGDKDGFFNGQKEGVHTMMFGGKMVVDHTRIEYCGQRDVLGRYCLHWHHVGRCPDCKFSNNAIVEGQGKGITIHGTHDALVHNNVVWNARGAGIYVEDGNEIGNTISNNVVGCVDRNECAIAENTGIYVVSYENNFINNRVSSYSNGIFFPGHGSGQGAARGRVCTSNSPYGTVKGNYIHHTGRFGLYVDNNFPKDVKKDANGFADRSTCGHWTADGRDNGKYSPMEDSFEWGTGAIGQYSAGDIQYLRITVIHSVLYWKQSKVFADGVFAHVKDSTFIHSRIMGPSGMFTFGIENVRFVQSYGALMMSGQHCGLESYHFGQHGVWCAAQYITKNVTGAFREGAFSFGASGGNPLMPTHSSMAGDDTFAIACRSPEAPIPTAECTNTITGAPAWTLVSGFMNGFTNVRGCVFYPSGLAGGDFASAGVYACPFPVRRLVIHSGEQGMMKLSGPGYDVQPNQYYPVFGQNAGIMNPEISWGNTVGYSSPVVAGETYTLEFNTLDRVRLEFSDAIVERTFGVEDTITLVLKAGGKSVNCVASASDCRAQNQGSCMAELALLRQQLAGTGWSGLPVEISSVSASSIMDWPHATASATRCDWSGGSPWTTCDRHEAGFIRANNDNWRMWKPKANDKVPTLEIELRSAVALSQLRVTWEQFAITRAPPTRLAIQRPRLMPGACGPKRKHKHTGATPIHAQGLQLGSCKCC